MFSLDRFDVTALRQQFDTADPFPYLMIDNFLDQDTLNKVEKELRDLKEENWYDKKTSYRDINNEPDSVVQSKKIALNIRDQIPPTSLTVIELFESKEMIQFIENVTGITELQRDESLMGGGIHRTTEGGRLAIHADFNIHPATNKHRRINALLYLNKEWDTPHQGELELWAKDMSSCVKKIAPVFNRMVLFRITDDAFHGHPEPWLSTIPRISFAFYYYTDNRPDNEKGPFHWALWQKRHEHDF